MNNDLNIILQEKILLMYAQGLNGYSVEEVSIALSESVPKKLTKNKGFIGSLLEKVLGSQAINNKSCVDFPFLGIELKSIPINKLNYPVESTFICNVPLTRNTGLSWKSSYFYQKIKKILWVSVQGDKKILLKNRLFKKSFIWVPSTYEIGILKSDWEVLIDKIILGKIKEINSSDSSIIQIKNKYSKKSNVITFTNNYGHLTSIRPKAFYFKKSFTAYLLKKFQ